MILILLAKIFLFQGEGIEFYQIPEKDSTSFYFIYRLQPREFPTEFTKNNERIRCINVYAEIKYKEDIIGALWIDDTIPADNEYYSSIKRIKVKRCKNYHLKTIISTCHMLRRFEKERSEKDLFPLSSLIPTLSDSVVKFAWYFDTTGYIAVYSNINDSGRVIIQKEYGGSLLKEKSVRIRKGWNFIPFDFRGLSPSTYRFTLILRDYKREVFIPVLMGTGWSQKEWNCMIRAVKYIFTKEEIDSLNKAPLERKQKLWNDFWKRRDPTKGTSENEAYVEFLRRFRYAQDHFQSIFSNTLSDLAVIYITLGPPNEVEKHEFEQNTNPYVIWYYYTYNLKFKFEDKFGTGNYELVDPPKYILSDIMESIIKR